MDDALRYIKCIPPPHNFKLINELIMLTNRQRDKLNKLMGPMTINPIEAFTPKDGWLVLLRLFVVKYLFTWSLSGGLGYLIFYLLSIVFSNSNYHDVFLEAIAPNFWHLVVMSGLVFLLFSILTQVFVDDFEPAWLFSCSFWCKNISNKLFEFALEMGVLAFGIFISWLFVIVLRNDKSFLNYAYSLFNLFLFLYFLYIVL